MTKKRDMQVVAYVCSRGGNWNNGLNNGPFYENWNNSPADTNINRGDRDILIRKSAYPGRKAESHTRVWQVGSMPKLAGECKRMLIYGM